MPKIIVNVPSMYKGQEVEVLYLGSFPNGGEYEVPDENTTLFLSMQRRHDPNWKFPPKGLVVGDINAKLRPAPKEDELPPPAIIEQEPPPEIEGGEG